MQTNLPRQAILLLLQIHRIHRVHRVHRVHICMKDYLNLGDKQLCQRLATVEKKSNI